MRIDSSGNVGIGTSNYSEKLTINGNTRFQTNAKTRIEYLNSTGAYVLGTTGGAAIAFEESGGSHEIAFETHHTGFSHAERMRITKAGNLLVNTTTIRNSGIVSIDFNGNIAGAMGLNDASSVNAGVYIGFLSGGTFRGSISNNNNTAVAYNTTSDYRLKENIAPMTGALDKVSQLKPCTYLWKENGSNGQGFIAHELVEVCPDAVTGEKDAVDKEGNPKYQGVDTSFLVATLTAAIQELKSIVDAQAERIAALESN
jgi:hypothetical protein